MGPFSSRLWGFSLVCLALARGWQVSPRPFAACAATSPLHCHSIRSWWSILLTSQADLLETWRFFSARLRCRSTSSGSNGLAPSRSLPSTSHCQVPPGNWTCPEWDAFPSPGSFPRTPKPLAQGPISLLTLEKQYLHPRAL
uniref:Uncharacterized protein n=1 Tax=Falco tinnunculus TaxID=100819 RepID=A0A8C4U2L9_FALTI